ncbi:phage tail tape measure protein [Sphingomonas pseudosanguinis]|uniref:TP901 family phage tail tape measure protein n=1 Tax=Sphingomonas pseudosanguinis TaxID=413712 RepID=A0A7W6A8D0_9SPHN|nr:phage tail tape measure protein [Sphingomonas pseudosanguinis]MBB3877910.1 TP901 family phage tail tape measure protein [Sphingomonas pseudosanguinis]MBN3537783.1 phage tail tape measure protein [Sphingomonas pseudosanguinis]
MDRTLRIRMLLEAGDRASRPLRDLAAGSSRAAESLRTAREELKNIRRAQADVAGFRDLRRGITQTSTELGAARRNLATARAAIASTANPTRAMTRDLAQAERQLEAVRRRGTEEAQQLRELRARMETAGISTRDLARHERDLERRAGQATDALSEQERRMAQLADRQRRLASARDGFARVQDRAGGIAAGGASAIAIGAATGAPLVMAARGAMDLEEGMAGVAKVTGLAGPQLQGMTNDIINLTTKIPMTATELSQIAAAAGAAGVGMDAFGRPLRTQAKDLVAFTDDAAQMGIAFDMTAEDAGATMAKWRQAFKMTQPEVRALGDRVNALTNKFGGNASSVAGIVTRIGPLGKVAGIAAPQVSALASSLNSIGVEEEVAATGIKNLLLNMTKGSSATKSQSKAFSSLGLDAVKLAKSMQVDASGTIVDLLERVGKLSPDKQASILSEMFGTESVGAIAPLLTNLDGVKQRLDLVGDRSKYAGSMAGEFASRISTAKGMTDIAKNAFEAVSLSIGQSMLPMIKEGALRFTAIAMRMGAFATRHPQLIKFAVILTGALAGLFFAIGAGSIILAAIMGPIALINAGLLAMGVAGGVASIGLFPIFATIAAIAGAVALVVAAWNHWDTISAAWFGFWGTLRAAFVSAGTFIADWGPRVGRFLMSGLLSMLNPMTLVNRVKALGHAAIGAFKSVLGIHSPSRVFAGLGGYMMEGLAGGITDGEGQPLRRVDSVAKRLTSAMALGTIAPGLAMAAPGAPGAGGAEGTSAMAARAPRITIVVQGAPGQSEQRLAELVAIEVAKVTGQSVAGNVSSFADIPDWENG